ncbi:MAG: rhodanese-like domain-containing protein [Nitrososphaeraceae archaeon]|nr:rhodanese-like domain-containing protein [Nitrososphaeraceae archaeon]MDW0239151.1 rhodanese-like domain-containing protein [Nitrososphaeraceae archaeon]
MNAQRTGNNQEIDPTELKKKIDNNEDIFILDVRTPQEYESWKLSYDNHQNPKLIPVDRLFTNDSNLLKEIPKDKEIVTLCAHGNRSIMAARLLNQLGYNVKSVRGGMAGWNKVYDDAEIVVPNDAPFRIWQIRRISKGCMGYIISSKEDSTAVVIDPSRENYEAFLNVAKENGLKIIKIIDTHQHADHVSGVAKLAKAINAQTHEEVTAYFSSLEEYNSENTEINIEYIQNGELIEISKKIWLSAIHTPGHTNGSFSFLIEHSGSDSDSDKTDGMKSTDNRIQYSYLFTGDTLFVDGVGRPDLREEAKKYAEMLYESYHQTIVQFPDNTLILPAHFNGSSNSLKHAVPISDTIGSLKKKVTLLSMNKDEFVHLVTDTLPARPMNYKTIIDINKRILSFDNMQMPDLEAGPNSCVVSIEPK